MPAPAVPSVRFGRSARALALVCALVAAECASGDASAPVDAGKATLSRASGLDKTPALRLVRDEPPYRATLVLYDKRATMNLQVIAQRGTESPTMERRLELLRPLLEQAFAEHGRAPHYSVTVGDYPELKTRLPRAAACSGEWDLASGRPKHGAAGRFIKDLIERDELHHELRTFFAPQGYTVSVGSVEKVMLCPWKPALTEASPTCPTHSRPGDRAPCSAMIVFHLDQAK